jgi:hypothetical protein
MKVRSHHAVRFFTGLALALSLFAQGCVGEVGDEEEIEAAPSAPEAVEPQEPPADPPAPKPEPPAAGKKVEKVIPAAASIHPREDVRRHGGRRLEYDPTFEPPPNPW